MVLRSCIHAFQPPRAAHEPSKTTVFTDTAHLPCPVIVLTLIRFVQDADVDAREDAAPFGDGGVIRDMTMFH